MCIGFAAAMSIPDTLDSREGLYGPIVDTGTDPAPLDALLGPDGRHRELGGEPRSLGDSDTLHGRPPLAVNRPAVRIRGSGGSAAPD